MVYNKGTGLCNGDFQFWNNYLSHHRSADCTLYCGNMRLALGLYSDRLTWIYLAGTLVFSL